MRNLILTLGLIALGFLNPVMAQLKVAIPFEPQIYYGPNSKSIVYEIHLMDSLKRPVEFLDFKISSESGLLLNDNEYSQLPKKKEINRYVKNIWIDINSVPENIIHEIKYKVDGETLKFTETITEISDTLLKIGLPVKKGIWYMQAAPSPTSYHRNTTIKSPSEYDISQDGFILGHCNQRFAIDFAKLDGDGLLYKNDGHKNIEHNCYGQDVIAVSDGTVVGVIDSIQEHENPPLIGDMEFKEFTGNLVLLDIGNNIIAAYAHMIPNSIIVKTGDKLKRGDLIGKIGNSGNSTAPHLHFHLSKPNFSRVDSSNILGVFWTSEGLSYVFDKYINYNIISGKYIESETEYISESFIINNPKIITNSMPYEDNIIEVK